MPDAPAPAGGGNLGAGGGNLGAGGGERLVIFDCDGVLVDSEVLVSQAEAVLLARSGVHLTAAQINDMFVGLSEPEMTRRIEQGWGVKLGPEFAAAKKESVFGLLSAHLQPVAGIEAVVAGVRARKCVASSSSVARVGLSLRKTGLARYFGDNVFTAGMVERGKPAPDLFLFAAERMEVAPARSVVVEDSPYGVEGAVAAGMAVIGFTGGGHCTEATPGRLLSAGAGAIAGSAGELAELLGVAVASL